jgi:hypothetical protein
MNRIDIGSHRGLLYALFAVFEASLWSSVIAQHLVDPLGVSGVDNAAGAAFLISFVGLFVVSWLMKRVAPRLATIGFLSPFVGFIAFTILPPVY